MRFLFFDRVLEAERGKRIRAVKVFPLSEPFLSGHFSRAPRVPGALLLEAMCQAAGWLILYSYGYEVSCVISLAEDVRLAPDLRPGAAVVITGEILDTNKRASLCGARVEERGGVIASAGRLIFPHFPAADPADLERRFRAYGWLDGLPAQDQG
jgi:3-hydroxyacyl-[acyl-carrier-protein] dehydratase